MIFRSSQRESPEFTSKQYIFTKYLSKYVWKRLPSCSRCTGKCRSSVFCEVSNFWWAEKKRQVWAGRLARAGRWASSQHPDQWSSLWSEFSKLIITVIRVGYFRYHFLQAAPQLVARPQFNYPYIWLKVLSLSSISDKFLHFKGNWILIFGCLILERKGNIWEAQGQCPTQLTTKSELFCENQ